MIDTIIFDGDGVVVDTKKIWYTIAGGLLGSLIEEGTEEIWPGLITQYINC